MKKTYLAIPFILILYACTSTTTPPPTGAIDTAVAQTVAAWTKVAPTSTNAEPTSTQGSTDPRSPTATKFITATPTSKKIVEEWEGVHLGMCADDVLIIHPKAETVSEPENLGTDAEGLIVRWNYPTASLVFKRRWGEDGIYCYRVQEIQLHR